ncbi:MAG: hypothetical protein JWM57_2504 [Phycisphaerales bacterium]|nr:hypothetical protein [Phycisphaerales bacterium]
MHGEFRFFRSAAILTALAATAQGAQLDVLANMDAGSGRLPGGGLIMDNAGNLFGTTEVGGTFDRGAVFEADKLTSTIKPLATFNGNNGGFATSKLTADGLGNLYGTNWGQPGSIDGQVFKYNLASQTLTTIAKFDRKTTGANPYAGVTLDAAGNIYGSTQYGGTSDIGLVFKITPGSSVITPITSFTHAFGGLSSSELTLDAAGNIYGSGTGTGNDFGAIFRIAAGSSTMTSLANFNQTNGSYPSGTLIFDKAGNMYGTTFEDGVNGHGTVFEIDAVTHNLTTLASFGLAGSGRRPQGALIMDGAGNLFGATADGGAFAKGTIFEVTAGSHNLIDVYDFDGTNGSGPTGSLIADANGDLYGTANGGGTIGGTVFRLSRAGFVVPEPAGLAVMGLAAIFTVRRRSRTS